MWWSEKLVRVIVVAAVLAASGCGFHLRGAANLPFETVAVPGTSPLIAELQRNLASATNAKVVRDAKEAQAVFELLAEAREKVILSLNSQGRVREYQLRYRVAYRVRDNKGNVFIPPSEVVLRRDISFNDQVLAKETEEQLLFRDMQTDMVQQIIRRMQAAKGQVDIEDAPLPGTTPGTSAASARGV